MKGVTQHIVARYSLALTATSKGVVTHCVRGLVAGRAPGLGVVDGASKSILHGHDELR